MSITIRRTWQADGVFTDVTSAVLCDPTGTYGVKRNDTNAVVVAANTAMTHSGTGVYSHTFTEPADGLAYTAYVKIVYGGQTYYFETDASAAIGDDSESTSTTPSNFTGLAASYTDLQLAVAYSLGFIGPNWSEDALAALSAAELADVDRIVQAGYRQFLWPPPVPTPQNIVIHQSASDAEKRPVERVRWSFLEPTSAIDLSSGVYAYDLPADFGGVLHSLTYGSGTDTEPLDSVTESYLRALRAGDAKSGAPHCYAVRPKLIEGTAIQRWQVLFYPTPDENVEVLAKYSVSPPELSDTNPYAYGGAAHSETLIESCLAIVEERKGDASQVHRERFFALLAASIQHDKTHAGAVTEDTWPVDDAGAATLDVTYDLLLKRVGHEFGLSWNAKTWATEDRRKVDMVIHQGLRQFYTPPPLPREKYAHEWSFLRPVATLTTTAPYTTGTVTVVAGVVTIDGGTWPSWAASGRFTGGNGVSVAVATRDSGSQITLEDTSITASAGSTFSLTPSAAYDLPADFSSFDGPLTFEPGETVMYSPIEMTAEHHVRSRLAEDASSGRPAMAAIRPKAIDQSAATRYEILFYPTPDAAYILTYRYRVNVGVLDETTNTYPPGGPQHGETILESCLSVAERTRDNKRGIHSEQFDSCLAASVSCDRKASAPDFMGYNGDASDGRESGDYSGALRRYTSQIVTYNGQSY